jgi:AMP-activated protein kinase-like protein
MTHEMLPPDELGGLINRLHQPVAVRPELARRAVARYRRRKARLTVTFGCIGMIVVAVVALRHRTGANDGVTFALNAPANRSVMLVGDFTDWRTDRVPLTREPSGTWAVTIKLPPGRYRFAFLVDDVEWRADTRAAPAMDAYGRPTSIITVAAQ